LGLVVFVVETEITPGGPASEPLFQTILPIARLPAVVSDGQDSNVRCHFEIDNVIGKPCHGPASDNQVGRKSADPGAGMRHRHDLIDGGIDSIEELDA
jgi:hypothetical protein